MNTLQQIQNWEELAVQTQWRATDLAKKCNVSLRTLQRHFHSHMGKSPKVWLSELRQARARTLLGTGISVKATAFELGYGHANQFSREFKHHWGVVPTSLAAYRFHELS